MNQFIKPIISIIMPVYNVERYLAKSINSVLNQSFKDFELICIDDGSTDNSGKICDEFAKKDTRIKVIHKENGGVASARQCGMDNIKGEYFIHLDPDDYYDYDMLQGFYDTAVNQNAGIVSSDLWIENINGEKKYIRLNLPNEPIAYIKSMLSNNDPHCMTGKLIKTKLSNNINFVKGVDCCEDLFFIVRILLINPVIMHIHKRYYHYVRRGDSIVHTITRKRFFSEIAFVDLLEKILDRGYFYDSILKKKCFIKYEMIKHNVISKDECKAILPICSYDVKKLHLSIFIKIPLLLSNAGFSSFLLRFYKYRRIIWRFIRKILMRIKL